MNIFYNYWDYITDKRGVTDSKGACATYLYLWLNELQKEHNVFTPAIDRDQLFYSSTALLVKDQFKMFDEQLRKDVYDECIPLRNNNETMNVIFMEWRMKTPNNTLQPHQVGYMPDLMIQNRILNQIDHKIHKLVIMDLDYALTIDDVKIIKPDCIVELGHKWKNLLPHQCSIQLTAPMNINSNAIKKYKIKEYPKYDIAYIGNDYDRDDDMNLFIKPVSETNKVIFYGNWIGKEADYPKVKFGGIASMYDFPKIYTNALIVPLITRNSYKENGFFTMRMSEALMFGSIPVGFSNFKGIKKYLPNFLIAKNSNELKEIILNLRTLSAETREAIRRKLIEKNAKKFNPKNLIKKLKKCGIL